MTLTPARIRSGTSDGDSMTCTLADGARALRVSSDWLVSRGRQLGIPPRSLHGLEVCLNELLANVIEHGGERGRTLPVRLNLRVRAAADPIPPGGTGPRHPTDGEATLTLRDGGISFDPVAFIPAAPPSRLADARPGGLGLVMVREISDALSYRREADANVVTVRVRWSEAAAG